MRSDRENSSGNPNRIHQNRKRLNFKHLNCIDGDLLGRDWKRTYKILIAGLMMMMPMLVSVSGDGFVIYGEESLEFLLEEDQYAIIDMESGIEKMLIKIDIEKKDVSNSTWVLPIPASPEWVRFDIEANMPSFSGSNIEEAYEKEMAQYKKDLLSLYYLSVFPGMRFLYGVGTMSDSAGGYGDTGGGVEVHSTIVFEGIHSELVSSEDPFALVEYLNEKGLPIQSGSLESFDHYIENNYSFIVTWIGSNSLKGLTPALYVDFPSDAIYYPMLLTSEYGDREVPVSLLINNWVKYEDGIELGKYTDFTYYRDSWDAFHEHEYRTMESVWELYPESRYMDYEELMENYGYLIRSHYLENQTEYSNRYTYVQIEAKAEKYTQDLYFKSFEPDVVEKQRKLDENADPVTWNKILSFAFFTMLTGALTGLIFFSKDKQKIIISVLISLFNIMAIWVFTIATLIFFRPKTNKDWFRFFGYTAVYHLIFFALVMIFIEPLFIFI